MYILSLIPSSIIHSHSYWQFVTYMFEHGGVWHLFSNMLGLYIFGTVVERTIGTREFLLFYFLTGILTGIGSFIIYLMMGMNVVLMGASGALYAVMFLFSVLYPHARVFVFGLIPISAPLLVVIYFGIELFGSVYASGSGIAHSTHLLGLVFAFLYTVIRLRINPFRAWSRT